MVFAGWEVLANAGDPGAVLEMGEVEAVARSFGIEVATFQIRRAEDHRARLRGNSKTRCRQFMSLPIRSYLPTGLESTYWRSVSAYPRCTPLESTSKREV